MRPALAAALALLCACEAGYTKGDVLPSDASIRPIGSGDAGENDAGSDAGLDAGSDGGSDAGCTALSLSAAAVIDGCYNGALGQASVNVTASNCSVSISSTTGTSCSGTASGANDAFDGGCGQFAPCASTSLPGNIVCTAPGMTSCTVSVCNGDC